MARDPIKDSVVNMFDAAHSAADNQLKPIKPVDSLVHGVAIGAKNCLCDEHPDKKCDCGPSKDKKKKPDDHKGCDEPHGKGNGGPYFDSRDSNKNNDNSKHNDNRDSNKFNDNKGNVIVNGGNITY